MGGDCNVCSLDVGGVTAATAESLDSTLERGFLPYHPLTKETSF
jgi:hypothetical protein